MTTQTKEVTLRKLIPSDGMLITDKETKTMRANEVWLGAEDSPDNYIEISKNSPLPNSEESAKD